MSNARRQKKARVRVCSSCEWIFDALARSEDAVGCPKCGSAHYGARWAIGPECYRLAKTQERWVQRKLAAYESKLRTEVTADRVGKDPNDLFANLAPVHNDGDSPQ
jgi:predicted RNA-binding Zn-ribbon protein involved in translation (DUF1610 family)